MRQSFWITAFLFVLCAITSPAAAQLLRGEWIDESEAAIEAHRKVDLNAIVIDLTGKPVPGADVRIDMLRHEFNWGMRLDSDDFKTWPQPPKIDLSKPIWRAINSVSLDDVTQWPLLQPHQNTWDYRPVDDLLEWCDGKGFTVRWGAVTSANPAKMPDWLGELDDAHFRTAIETHIRRVMADYGKRVDQFDLHAGMIDQKFISARLGNQMIRKMYELGRAVQPRATIGARYNNAISGHRLQKMVKSLTTLEENFVPVDLVVFDERVSGTVLQVPLSRAMKWLTDLDQPAVVGHLEVGGSSPTAAAVNLETLLRVLFAEPKIKGIWMGGMTAEDFDRPNAALIDDKGELTPAGGVFDKLVREHWWSNERMTADELGNVRARVFAGTYRITATLPDGSVAEAEVFLPLDGTQRIVMLQPIPVNAAPAIGERTPARDKDSSNVESMYVEEEKKGDEVDNPFSEADSRR